jgi:hypothetical protein
MREALEKAQDLLEIARNYDPTIADIKCYDGTEKAMTEALKLADKFRGKE